MSLRFHEIAESNHRIQNPLSEARLMQLGEMCHLHEAVRQLDLACGRGEMLCRWAQAYGIAGTGVDLSPAFIEAARVRAHELEVWSSLTFEVGDAGAFPQAYHQFNIVSCLGATWIGGGLLGTLTLMKQALKDGDGLLLVGEPFWKAAPTDAVCEALQTTPDTFTTLGGLPDRFDAAGVELIDMLISSQEEWDRYYTQQWTTVRDWLHAHPDDPDAAELRRWIDAQRRTYLQVEREYLGWGVFVLKPVSG